MRVDSVRETVRTIRHITTRWRGADKTILRHVFPLLAEGRPVAAGRLARAAGIDVAVVEDALLQGRSERDEYGRVTELFGIMLAPTPHRIEVGQTALFSCCALMSHLSPLLFEHTATVESVDPVVHWLVRLTISPKGVLSAAPQGAVGTLVATEEAAVLQDVRTAFCSHVRHFVSRETAAEFASMDSRRYIVGLDEFQAAARALHTAIWD